MNLLSEKIKEGIQVHYRTTNKYKTNLVTVFLSVPLDRKTVTLNALITAILRLGTKLKPTQEAINKKLEEMYGAEFNCGVEKISDTQILKFYIDVLNDNFVPTKENLLEQAINELFDIIFNPVTENGSFLDNYISTEKVNLKNLIESKINDKDQYSFDRCIEEMYKNDSYSIYKYGYVEDINSITKEELYKQYIKLIETAKIDIYVSGDFNKDKIKEIIETNDNIKNLQGRSVKINTKLSVNKELKDEPTYVEEKKNVTQGKLVIGLDINDSNEDLRYVLGMYNAILGASATSKLFQNVREKASLAYSARSVLVWQKNNIYIRCGIEINNFEKAMPIINKQLEDMKNGHFTEEDVKGAKRTFESAIKGIQDEQDAEITYFIAQELAGLTPNFEEYMEKINSVTKEQIQDVANKIKVNTIYFLRD